MVNGGFCLLEDTDEQLAKLILRQLRDIFQDFSMGITELKPFKQDNSQQRPFQSVRFALFDLLQQPTFRKWRKQSWFLARCGKLG